MTKKIYRMDFKVILEKLLILGEKPLIEKKNYKSKGNFLQTTTWF